MKSITDNTVSVVGVTAAWLRGQSLWQGDARRTHRATLPPAVRAPTKSVLLLAAVLAVSAAATAQDGRHTHVTAPEALVWKENPAFPKGVRLATLVGDPAKAGDTVVLRIKFPPNFLMPPHTHPYSEVVTVVSGRIGTNAGESPEVKGDLLSPGALWVYPAKHAHYAWTGDEEAILQVHFIGPGGIDYINPADDPRKGR